MSPFMRRYLLVAALVIFVGVPAGYLLGAAGLGPLQRFVVVLAVGLTIHYAIRALRRGEDTQ